MKKTILIIVALIIIGLIAAGMYKFNYLSYQTGYDADGNKTVTVHTVTHTGAEVSSVTGQLAGSDRDMHGCISSAGYTWSQLRNTCIRLFEVGEQYEAYSANTDRTLAAYVVTNSSTQVEVFLPRATGSVILTGVPKTEGDIAPVLFVNTGAKIEIISSKDEQYISQDGELTFVRVQINTPTESYSAEIQGKKVTFSVFSQKEGFSTYQLIEGDKISSGSLNYERGFGDDENATVYVLNFDKAETEQKRFVRTSAKNDVISALNGEKVDTTYVLISQQ